MKVFVWERVKHCTGSWHTEGGVVVFADSEERARELANTYDGCRIAANEKPSAVVSVTGDVPEMVYIMPDAGCC